MSRYQGAERRGDWTTGMFERRISTGDILQVIVILLALWGVSSRQSERMSAVETKVDAMWLAWTSGRAIPAPKPAQEH